VPALPSAGGDCGAGAVAGKAGRGGSGGSGGGGGGGGPAEKKLQTNNKGTFIFTKVADGLFVQHKWGANSGQIGIPNESLKDFAQLVLSMSGKGGGGKGAAKPASKGVAKKEKKKKEPEKKPTAEELDADLGAPSCHL